MSDNTPEKYIAVMKPYISKVKQYFSKVFTDNGGKIPFKGLSRDLYDQFNILPIKIIPSENKRQISIRREMKIPLYPVIQDFVYPI